MRTVAVIGAGQMGSGIAQTVAQNGIKVLLSDVDLATGDVVFAAVERSRLGEPEHGVLRRGVGRRIRPRCMRRDGAVVDDAAAHRILSLHDTEGGLDAQGRQVWLKMLSIASPRKRWPLYTDMTTVTSGVMRRAPLPRFHPSELLDTQSGIRLP